MLWYNGNCPGEQSTEALFYQAAYFPEKNIQGKAPLTCGLASSAVHLDNGSARRRRFALMDKQYKDDKRYKDGVNND